MEKYLTLEQAGDAKYVTRWLRERGPGANRKDAELFFEWGVQDRRRRHWSGAVKDFGESMIRYPGPEVLIAYANAELRLLGDIRAKDKNIALHGPADMKRALSFYEAALAADGILNSLPADEKELVQKNVESMKVYLRTGKQQPDCPPLQYFVRSHLLRERRA